MRHIIIEGGDNLGKSLLIKGICEAIDYDNVMIRHFGKPPKNLSPKESVDFQFTTFNKEYLLVKEYKELLESDDYGYYNNTVIWNRSHLGEFVYAQMFRGISHKALMNKVREFERNVFEGEDEVYLISLTAGPEFFLKQEDGDSFSQTIEEKTRELELFREITKKSLIENKLNLKVNRGKNYKNATLLLGEVLEFLNIGMEKNNYGKK